MSARAPRRFRLTEEVEPEDKLQRQVLKALLYLLPADAVVTAWELKNAKSKQEGERRKRNGCLAGWPDMGVLWRGRLVLLELKRRGGYLSEAQRALHPRLAHAGFPVVLVRSPDDAIDAVSAAGVPLRGRIAA